MGAITEMILCFSTFVGWTRSVPQCEVPRHPISKCLPLSVKKSLAQVTWISHALFGAPQLRAPLAPGNVQVDIEDHSTNAGTCRGLREGDRTDSPGETTGS